MYHGMAKFLAARAIFSKSLTTFCDETSSAVNDSTSNSLIDQADAILEQKSKIKAPKSFEIIKSTIQQQSVNTFDGFRLVVQKQCNLNTAVSHFYWMGSQQVGPIYQYRVILPFEDKFINVATDLDSNIEGEVKLSIQKNLSVKTNFVIGEQANNFSATVDYSDDDSTTQLEVSKALENSLSVSRMQAITPHLSLGGLGRYSFDKGTVSTSIGGLYDDEKSVFAAEWDSAIKVMYMRRINPERVHLSSELIMDENENKVSVNAEYILKQSKIHMGIDSNLSVKSSLETALSTGVSMQISAEMNQLKDQYRFGYGISMG